MYQYCLKMCYLHSLKCAGVIKKFTILECKNGLVYCQILVDQNLGLEVHFSPIYWATHHKRDPIIITNTLTCNWPNWVKSAKWLKTHFVLVKLQAGQVVANFVRTLKPNNHHNFGPICFLSKLPPCTTNQSWLNLDLGLINLASLPSTQVGDHPPQLCICLTVCIRVKSQIYFYKRYIVFLMKAKGQNQRGCLEYSMGSQEFTTIAHMCGDLLHRKTLGIS